MTVKQLIRRRERLDLSQRELSERSGVTQKTISRIETGQTWSPNPRTMDALDEALTDCESEQK